MDNKGISARLWLLSKAIEEKVNDYKSRGHLTKIKQQYIKPKVDNFDYKEGGISYQMSQGFIFKEEWDIKKLFDFIEKTVKQIPDYHRITVEISKRYKVNEVQADSWLQRFTQTLIWKAPENLPDETLIDTISTFVNDLENGSLDWKLEVWLDGIWLEDEEYDIYEGLKIRRFKPSDLEVAIPIYMALYPMPGSSFRDTSSAILELVYRAREAVECQNEIEKIVNCLRLYKLGSVFPVKTQAAPKSILRAGGTSWPGQRFALTYKYPISKDDIPQLGEFISKIKGLLPTEPLSALPKVIDPVNIALQRYNDALLKPESTESRITSAITCFEALYLKAEERMELSHRLSQRAAALLGLFNLVPLEIYNNLNRAYDIRSTFIHGSSIELEKYKDIAELAEKTLDYARVSLLIFLQLKSLTDKDNLINKIDNSLLDTNARSKLEELVKGNCSVFSEV